MKTIILASALALAGCGLPGPSERAATAARRICATNGHVVGTNAFDRCFASTFASMLGNGVVVAGN
jgi:hypothetical protein